MAQYNADIFMETLYKHAADILGKSGWRSFCLTLTLQ